LRERAVCFFQRTTSLPIFKGPGSNAGLLSPPSDLQIHPPPAPLRFTVVPPHPFVFFLPPCTLLPLLVCSALLFMRLLFFLVLSGDSSVWESAPSHSFPFRIIFFFGVPPRLQDCIVAIFLAHPLGPAPFFPWFFDPSSFFAIRGQSTPHQLVSVSAILFARLVLGQH